MSAQENPEQNPVYPVMSKLQPNQVLALYPEGQAAGKGLPEAEGPLECNGYVNDEFIEKEGCVNKTGDEARIELYFPKKPNGQMVICCPGGGYKYTSSYNEGVYVADWMTKRGITVCVVKYRMPNGHWVAPLQDVQNAFRYCRAHAGEWKINQIGIIGFSAGGHLAATASTLFVDDVTRPDFSVLIYPVITLDRKLTHKGTRHNLIGADKKWDDESVSASQWKANQKKHKELEERYSLHNQVSDNTPTTFIAVCTDDKTVPVQNSIMYYSALVDYKVPAEMHVWPSGGHGWGFRKQEFQQPGKTDAFGYARKEFDASLERWLKAVYSEQINK